MNDYIQLRVNSTPCSETITDLLSAFLCDVGYESFVADENGLTAFIAKCSYNRQAVDDILSDFPIDCRFTFSIEEIEGRDWNEEWEKNYFQPIIIDNSCVVHSSFHHDVPKAKYDIVIDPKMAFGTGHHATTSQIIRYILNSDITGKSVIDMGTGTGILALLSKMMGASSVDAIEIDEFAYTNAVENAEINNVSINYHLGGVEQLSPLHEADYFFANINRNVITADIKHYSEKVKPGGIVYLSGFYEEDIPVIVEAAQKFGMRFVDNTVQDKWAAVKLKKDM